MTADGGGDPGTAGADGSRWFHIDVHDGAVDELARALSATGCLVLQDAAGLRAALPGAPAAEAEASIRAFLASWRFGTSAELRPPA